MRIKRLTLNNFRAFENPEPFEFSGNFSVIAGINGRGKTSILDAVAILASRLARQIDEPIPRQYRSVTIRDIHRGAETFNISMDVLFAETPLNFPMEYGKRQKYLAQSVRKAINQVPLTVYYTTDRAVCRMPRKVPDQAPLPRQAAFLGALVNSTVDFRDLITRVRMLRGYSTFLPGSMHYKMLKGFEHVMKVFLPGFTSLHVDDKTLALTVKKNDKSFNIDQLSDGERAFLALTTDLTRRLTLAHSELKDPLKGEAIVLIDELELHLHPRWQRTVIDNLKSTFPNVQFIATTHSPFIIQSLNSDELILLDDVAAGDFSNRGLEEIVIKIMGIEDPNVTPRYLKMLDVATKYFKLIEDAPNIRNSKRTQLKRKLNAMIKPYKKDNPAYEAFLEMQRVRAFRE